MKKVRFIESCGSFAKDSYRTILGEDKDFLHIQKDLHRTETMAFHRENIGLLFEVVERS